jgi:hypothetical protein
MRFSSEGSDEMREAPQAMRSSRVVAFWIVSMLVPLESAAIMTEQEVTIGTRKRNFFMGNMVAEYHHVSRGK